MEVISTVRSELPEMPRLTLKRITVRNLSEPIPTAINVVDQDQAYTQDCPPTCDSSVSCCAP